MGAVVDDDDLERAPRAPSHDALEASLSSASAFHATTTTETSGAAPVHVPSSAPVGKSEEPWWKLTDAGVP